MRGLWEWTRFSHMAASSWSLSTRQRSIGTSKFSSTTGGWNEYPIRLSGLCMNEPERDITTTFTAAGAIVPLNSLVVPSGKMKQPLKGLLWKTTKFSSSVFVRRAGGCDHDFSVSPKPFPKALARDPARNRKGDPAGFEVEHDSQLPFTFCRRKEKKRFQSWIQSEKNAPTVPAEAKPTGHPDCPQNGQIANME